jgi:hypothetical protein
MSVPWSRRIGGDALRGETDGGRVAVVVVTTDER